MSSRAAAAPPPPPRPDPVTLEQIYDHITSTTASSEAKAYHVVALGSVAFHPAVKLFCFEHTPLPPPPTSADAAAAAAAATTREATVRANTARREALLRQVAFLLTQRTSPVYAECRWETVSLLGELCRLDRVHTAATTASATMGSPRSPHALLEAKLNAYARSNLEFLAQLPWFVPACEALMRSGGGSGGGDDGEDKNKSESSSTATGSSRDALRERLRRVRRQRRDDDGDDTAAAADGEDDEDVVIALRDLLRALPTCVATVSTDKDGNSSSCKRAVTWSPAQLQQAHDLMFIDASTSLLHLIPHVSRSSSASCARCGKTPAAAATTSTNDNNNTTTTPHALLRCGSCKAVYYCSAACQRAHWAAVHRAPCVAYKTRCEQLLAQYYAVNRTGKRGTNSSSNNKCNAADKGVTVLEVPLEPTLFYETRRYLYDHRDSAFADVSFYDYFMKYTTHGS